MGLYQTQIYLHSFDLKAISEHVRRDQNIPLTVKNGHLHLVCIAYKIENFQCIINKAVWYILFWRSAIMKKKTVWQPCLEFFFAPYLFYIIEM